MAVGRADFTPDEADTRDERGAGQRGGMLVLFSSLLAGLLAVSALVIDLGLIVVQRRRVQAAADLAALAAGKDLGNPTARDPRQACRSAVAYLAANLSGGWQASDAGCDGLPMNCSEATAPVSVKVHSPDSSSASITYPVPDEMISSPWFREGAWDGDQCERMEVSVSIPVHHHFASMFGRKATTVTARAVVRGTVGFKTKINPALLLLKRFGCAALSASGQGRIWVRAHDENHPGVIASDAAGHTVGESPCTLNTNRDGYVVFGTQTPAGVPAIEAEDAANRPAQLLLAAKTLGSERTAWHVPSGVYPQPGRGLVVSRRPVDDLYNPTERPAVEEVREEAITLVASSASTMRGKGYAVFPQDFAGARCDTTEALVIRAERVFVDCGVLGPKSQGSVVFDSERVVVRGRLSVGQGNFVGFPRATRVIVGGPGGVDVAGLLGVNDGGFRQGDVRDCSRRRFDPSVRPSVLVVVDGPLAAGSSSFLYLCETTVVMADVPIGTTRTTGGNCSTDLPCPAANSGDGYVSVQGSFQWTAPNETSAKADAEHPFEDLALWTETSATTTFKGQGNTRASGVFFLPNAHVQFLGQGSQTVALDAQFIASSLDMSGQGVLSLDPNPNDVVPVPYADFRLIR
ncbi:MAG: hypothetical protein KatS3mg008_2237 [Acidimicrobiales bacterium]|nr:MAG: hypothetical protein KatS3mg008_2237 [Acidimicrobiales bacterium]